MIPKVSAIIPVYNQARFVAKAIESALKQTLPPAEVIVVDDGSTDNTAEVLTDYVEHIRIIRQSNQGVAAARNAGAELASGELLGFLDADDVWLPRKLERQVGRFLAEPDLGLVHCSVEEIDADGTILCQRPDGIEGWIAAKLLFFDGVSILGGGSGVLISRAAFKELGGFDTRMSTAADWDFYYRLAVHYKIGFVPEPLLQYRLHSGNMHTNFRAMEHDMLLAFNKAFQHAPAGFRHQRRRSYGNLHTVLAGCYFSAGEYGKFLSHAMKGLLLRPGNFAHFLGYPVRWWHRRWAQGKATTLPNRMAQNAR